jgi:hypothetical protein
VEAQVLQQDDLACPHRATATAGEQRARATLRGSKERTGLEVGARLLDLGAHAVVEELDVPAVQHKDEIRKNKNLSAAAHRSEKGSRWRRALAEELAEDLDHGTERVLLLGQAVGATEVAHEDDAGAVLEGVLDGGQRGLDALRVADLALIKGHVEIDPGEERGGRE